MSSTQKSVNQKSFDEGFPCDNQGLARLSYVNIFQDTVDSRYNEPRRKTKNSSLYREFVKSKIEKNLEFLLKYLKNPV